VSGKLPEPITRSQSPTLLFELKHHCRWFVGPCITSQTTLSSNLSVIKRPVVRRPVHHAVREDGMQMTAIVSHAGNADDGAET